MATWLTQTLYFMDTGEIYNQILCQLGLAIMTKQYNTPPKRSSMALGVNARRRRPGDVIASYTKRGQFLGLWHRFWAPFQAHVLLHCVKSRFSSRSMTQIQSNSSWFSQIVHDFDSEQFMIQSNSSWFSQIVHDSVKQFMAQSNSSWPSQTVHGPVKQFMIQSNSSWFSQIVHDSVKQFIAQSNSSWFSQTVHSSVK